MEGFGMLNNYEMHGYDNYDSDTGAFVNTVPEKTITDFALGFGVRVCVGLWVARNRGMPASSWYGYAQIGSRHTPIPCGQR